MATVISRKYEVVGQLGQGGMGLVYKVRHTALETISALKVLPAYLMENQDMVNRFYREARVMARLNHPNIVKVLDIERDESLNLYYFVMEYIEGVTLGKYLREKGPLPLPEVLAISHQVADALAYAHNHTPPIIHRDIKPANIMIEAHSSRVVVMDFGIAKELGDGDSTKTGMVIGTLKYASPEQLRHEALDGSADVYSLGMVMYEMYAGKQFFGGLDEHAVLGKVLYDTSENIPAFDRPPPAAFATLLTQAMAKNRSRRYPSMQDLLKALDTCNNLDQEDDASGTLILPGLGGKSSSSKEAPADDDLERQIRELEEERQRRRVLPIQTQAREAREHAAREGAAEWTGPLFQQGLVTEEQGARNLRERDFTLAQQAFAEAIQLFERASIEAQTAAAKRRVEQAKEAMAAAKEEAEHYGAREHARTRYTRGLTLESQAEDFAEKADFQQALQIYNEASRFFADARELAYRETLKQEAENARNHAVTAKVAAEEKGAGQFAHNLFREATVQEERANAAIAHEEFTQARELFLAAAQKYERARQHAQVERQRQEAIASQQQAREAQGQAVNARAREFATKAYEQAVQLQQQGDGQFQANAYEIAAVAYLQARDEYERATQEAELEQEKQTTGIARQQLQQAQALADRVEAQAHAATPYEQARLLVNQGEESERQHRYREARDLYSQATQRFQQLAREVAVLIAQERADAARQEMTVALQGSDALHTWAPTSWTKAHERRQRAEEAYQKQEYGRAAEHYSQAAQAYRKARADAEQEQLQHETRDARQLAREARTLSESVQADHYAAELHRQGREAQQKAEQQEKAREYSAAIQGYTRAATLWTEATTTAQRERSRREALTAQQQAEEARSIAEQAGASQHFTIEFSQALRLSEQAAQEEQQQDFTQALGTYQQAATLWRQLAEDATRAAEKEKAETARARLAEARATLSGLNEWRGDKWTEAERFEALGHEAWTAQHYTQASEAYNRGAQCYEEAYSQAEETRQAAERERQQHWALDIRQQAAEARMTAEKANAQQYAAPLYQQAAHLAEQATQHMDAQRWLEARELFSQARSLWSQAAHDAQQAQDQQAATAIRQRLNAARTAAEQAEAHTRFSQEFTRAQQLTAQGEQEEAQQNFTQAAEFYEQALQQLLRLRHEADIQAEREHAEAARQPMLNAKEQASPLQQWAKAPWEAAQKLEMNAERLFKGQDYVAALSSFEQASQAYVEAAETGEREHLRQEALQAEKQAATTKKKAEDESAPLYAGTEFNHGTTAITEAERHKQHREFAEATQAYLRAKEYFNQAIVVAQREQAKLQMQAVRHATEEALSSLLLTEAEQRLPQDVARGREILQKGYTAEEQQEFTTARHCYEQAQQQFVALAQSVQQHIVHEQADLAKQSMLQAKKEANTLAPSFAVALWQEAQSHEAEGERSWQAQAYEQAHNHYDQAGQLYARAHNEAIEEEQRQRVATAKEKAKNHQNNADALQAVHYAGEQYHKAQTVTEQAEAALAARKFTEAENLFTQAAEAFDDVITKAQAIRAQQLAVDAREKTIVAQAEAQAARSEEFLPGQYAEAVSLFQEAEKAFTSEKFDDARTQFERLTLRWQKIRQEAEIAQQKRTAETSKTRAYELRELVHSNKNKQKKRAAEKAIAAGDQFLQKRQYTRAQASYDEACTILVTLQSQDVPQEAPAKAEGDVQREKQPHPLPVTSPSTSRQVSPLIAGIGAFVVVAIVGLYFSGMIGPTTPTETKPNTKAAAQAEAERLKAEQAKAAQAEAERLKAEQATAQAEAERLKAEQAKAAQAKAKLPLSPPKLTLAQPEASRKLTIAEGKSLSFAVDADSEQPQLLQFAWFVDGKKQADGKKWNFQPGYEDGGDQVREVKVVVTDGKNPPLENIWKVRVEDVDRAPTIASAIPKAGAITITAGEKPSFSVQASDPDKDDRLVYVWSVDGKEVARGDERSWQLPASTSDTSRAVKVEVFDQAGKSAQLAWNVTSKLPALPPRIVDVEPAGTSLTIDVGNPLDFTVTAEVEGPGSGRKGISYLWSIDNARPQRSESGRFRFAETRPGTYELSVTAVGPEGLQSTAKRWTVEVKPIEVARPQPPPRVEPPPPISTPLSQQEAMNWLETTYRQAWESKNVNALVQMGEISSQDAAKLKAILDGYKEYRVSFTDVNVRNEGSRVIVRFSRVDTIDGKTMRPIPAKEVTLEKGDGGRIARRR